MKIETPTTKLIDLIFAEIKDFESNGVQLTDNVYFSQYETLQKIKTHQNNGFLSPLAKGQNDDRWFFDIITPMVETGIVNIDLDANNFEPYVVNDRHQAQQILAKSLLNIYLKQANQSETINSSAEAYVDDGNIVSRKIGTTSNGEIFKPVNLLNLYVIDQSAETLEDTPVIEKQIMNQSQLRKMTEWSNIDKFIALGNFSNSDKLPSYEVYYRYGDISRADYNKVQNELTAKTYEEKDEDKNEYIQALVIVGKVKKGKEYNGERNESQGVVLFAEELQPEVIKISDQLEITKYKPYEEAHFGKYCERWLRKGYREVGITYQNRANELGNQIRKVMKLASKILFWSKDKILAGKNILEAIKDGQVISAEHLDVLNNVFPNLTLFSTEWNRNITECQKALKAFEAASGEALPSSTSATAIAVQNQQVGKYYDFKREKIGIFFANIYKRWVIPTLLKKTSTKEKIEIVGDPSFIEEYTDALAQGWIIQNTLLTTALSGGVMTKEQFEQLKDIKKQELLKNKRHFLELEKDFFSEAEIYIGINPTGELFNKQAKVSNGLQLLQYITNPAVMSDPASRDIVMDIALSLGFRIKPSQIAQQLPPQGQVPNSNVPQKEGSLVNETLGGNKSNVL